MELPFAAVQQLCAPFLELMAHLPEPQRDALDVAFGLSTGPAPNPFLVGLAVLGLLSEAAEKRPLLTVVDVRDEAFAAAARRLAGHEPVFIVEHAGEVDFDPAEVSREFEAPRPRVEAASHRKDGADRLRRQSLVKQLHASCVTSDEDDRVLPCSAWH